MLCWERALHAGITAGFARSQMGGIVGLHGRNLESPDSTLVNSFIDKYLITAALTDKDIFETIMGFPNRLCRTGRQLMHVDRLHGDHQIERVEKN